MLGSINIGEIQREKKKAIVSLSLNKKNLEFIKEDLKKNGDGLTLSGLFDFVLEDMVNSIKKENNKKNSDNGKQK